jgi:phosphoribosylformylglycinamidine cyclo-ligase
MSLIAPAQDNKNPSPLRYKDAGVDIAAGDDLVERIKPLAKRTHRPGVLGGIGGFGGLFALPEGYKEPVLVSGTDGVGTKLKLAFEWNMHDGIGIDLVAMSVNDILVQGAQPLYFLDYFSCGKLDVEIATRVIAGIAQGCELAGCALLGGETAEMPGMYPEGEYDLAGFAVGVVEKNNLITGQSIGEGDVLLGLPSSGVHSNGYSLVRKVMEREAGRLPSELDGVPFQNALMAPTKIYVTPLLNLMEAVHIKGMAHITGGGLTENIPRVLPDGTSAVIQASTLPKTELFTWLQASAGIDDAEMRRTFNCGVGMVVIVDAKDVQKSLDKLALQGVHAQQLGVVSKTRGSNNSTVLYT